MRIYVISYFSLLTLAFMLLACKAPLKNDIENTIKSKEKSNILERTKWKASTNMTKTFDIILDFYTDKNVAEYILNQENEEVSRVEGMYKTRGKSYVLIKWQSGKPIETEEIGSIQGKKLTLKKKLTSEIYHKIADY